MDELDRAKLKVLVKMLLIQRSPNHYTTKQLVDRINSYNWGFRTTITNKKLSSMLKSELNRSQNHFLDGIEYSKRGNYLIFKYVGEN